MPKARASVWKVRAHGCLAVLAAPPGKFALGSPGELVGSDTFLQPSLVGLVVPGMGMSLVDPEGAQGHLCVLWGR